MVTQQTHEVHSPEITRDDVLKLVPQFEVQSLLRRHHLDRELIVGIVGLRGDGKSASTASISLVDFMFEGKPVWSNMEIKCDVEIDRPMAEKYGLSRGGVARFESQPLEKEALLRLDDMYRGGCLAIEEINVQYSNVRRFMTNTNVDFNVVVQQLRKFQTSMVYNVIDEMFIDPQLRTLTDVFIKCEETALSAEGLASKKQPGLDFKWTIYPMSGYLVGREKSYYITKKPLAPVYFHFAPLRDIYDDKQYQKKGLYSMSNKLKASMRMETSPDLAEQVNEWAWLEEKVRVLKNSGISDLEAPYLWSFLELSKRGITPQQIGKLLPSYGITKQGQNRHGQWLFKIDNYDIENIVTHSLVTA